MQRSLFPTLKHTRTHKFALLALLYSDIAISLATIFPRTLTYMVPHQFVLVCSLRQTENKHDKM